MHHLLDLVAHLGLLNFVFNFVVHRFQNHLVHVPEDVLVLRRFEEYRALEVCPSVLIQNVQIFTLNKRQIHVMSIVMHEFDSHYRFEKRTLIQNREEVVLSNGLALDCLLRLVDEFIPNVVADLKATNYCHGTPLLSEISLLVDFVPDIVSTLFDKKQFNAFL